MKELIIYKNKKKYQKQTRKGRKKSKKKEGYWGGGSNLGIKVRMVREMAVEG